MNDRRPTRIWGNFIVPLLFIGLGAWMIQQTAAMSTLGSVFPRTIAAVMLVCSIAVLARELLRPAARDSETSVESTPRRLAAIVVMGAWVLLLPVLGFFTTSLCAFLLLLAVANYDGWSPRRALAYGATAIAVMVSFYVVFVRLLLVPTPRGWFL
jgi:hypothetical protein